MGDAASWPRHPIRPRRGSHGKPPLSGTHIHVPLTRNYRTPSRHQHSGQNMGSQVRCRAATFIGRRGSTRSGGRGGRVRACRAALRGRVVGLVENSEQMIAFCRGQLDRRGLARVSALDAMGEGEVGVAADLQEQVDEDATVSSGHLDACQSHRSSVSRRCREGRGVTASSSAQNTGQIARPVELGRAGEGRNPNSWGRRRFCRCEFPNGRVRTS